MRIFAGRFPDISKMVLQVICPLTAKNWLNAISRIFEEGITAEDLDDIPFTDEQLPLLEYMLRSHHREFYGFPAFDHRHFVPASR